MSLLREIQEEATKSDSNVLVLLRKCRVLATRIGNQELKNWVQKELDGYTEDEALPSYRTTKAHSKGHFSGPFQSGLRNADIPSACIPKKYQSVVNDVFLRQGIGAYCDLLANNDKGSFQIPWSPNLCSLVGQGIYEHMNLLQAWQVLPRGTIVNVVETVKNRILNFSLELESEDPKAGEALEGSNKLTPQKVTHIFNTYITGNVGNISSGGSSFSQNATISITQGDLDELIDFLAKKGITTADTDELKDAIHIDGESPKSTKKFGSKVATWVGNMISKSASGIWDVATSTATSVLTEALKKYYGIS